MLMKQSDKVNPPAEQPYTKGQAHVSRMLTMASFSLPKWLCSIFK